LARTKLIPVDVYTTNSAISNYQDQLSYRYNVKGRGYCSTFLFTCSVYSTVFRRAQSSSATAPSCSLMAHVIPPRNSISNLGRACHRSRFHSIIYRGKLKARRECWRKSVYISKKSPNDSSKSTGCLIRYKCDHSIVCAEHGRLAHGAGIPAEFVLLGCVHVYPTVLLQYSHAH
jgi:hypothetical protein